ncbi:MAG: carbon storage regulator CsrA [Thermoguttaceae bacterium]
MLVFTRQRDQSIVIADNIVVTLVDVRGDKVRLGIEAPAEIPVHRQEVYESIMGGKPRDISSQAHRNVHEKCSIAPSISRVNKNHNPPVSLGF